MPATSLYSFAQSPVLSALPPVVRARGFALKVRYELVSLCILRVLCVSVAIFVKELVTTETQRCTEKRMPDDFWGKARVKNPMSISRISHVVVLWGNSTEGAEPMKYMLLIYHEEQSWESLTEAEREQIYGEYRQLRGELESRGQFLDGSELQPVTTATAVRIRDGKELITDGPFAETHEQLGGYFLIEAKDLDEATSIAARIPSARTGTIEVRPLAEMAAEATA